MTRERPIIEVRYRPPVPGATMLAHLRVNLAGNYAELRPQGPRRELLVLAAGGPSLPKTLEEVAAASKAGAKVLAVNEVPRFLLDHGIRPWAAAHIGPVDLTMRSIGEPVEGLHYYLASICPPGAFERVAGHEIVLWHPQVKGLEAKMRAAGADPAAGFIGGGHTVTLRCLELAATLGFRRIAFHGGDSSFRERFHAYASVADAVDIEACSVECAGREFTATAELVGQAIAFPAIRQRLARRGVTIEVMGEGLLPHLTRTADETGTVPPVRLLGGKAAIETRHNRAVIEAQMF